MTRGCRGPLAAAAAACTLLAACAVGDRAGVDEDGCPDPDLARRYALVGSARLCGGCDPDCRLTTDVPNQTDLDTNPRIWPASTAYDPAKGGIVIVPPGVRVVSNYAWLANTAISTVTKIRLQTFKAHGVYRVGLSSLGVGGNWPSRTTVDIMGCAYVAQRAFDGQGSVTKIAGELDDCVDLNGNGVIDSSTGLGDIRGWPGSGTQDECVLWNVPVGPVKGTPRALAVDALGRIWVGLYNSQQFVVLDNVDGHVISTVNVAVQPYGAAIAPDGRLWTTTPSDPSVIQSINTYTLLPTNADVGPAIGVPDRVYGVAVDEDSRVFLGSLTTGGIVRYTPSTGTFASGDNGAFGASSGVTVMLGRRVFASDLYDHHVSMYDSDSLAVLGGWDVGGAGGLNPHGVCPDFWDHVWTGNLGSANSSVLNVGGGLAATSPTQSLNYTYSDFTGYGLMTFAAMVGYVFRDYDSVDACGGPSTRERVYYRLTFPNPGVVNFYGRSSDTAAGLDTAPETWLGVADTPEGSAPIRGPMSAADASRRFFRLRIELLRAGIESPVVHEYTIEEYCL